jgi:small subunit ribosomal protein S7
VRVGSTSLVRRGRYLDWVIGCRELVHARTGGKVGYVHVPDMEESGYAHFSRQFLAECHHARRVLLIDLRWNVGGVTSDVLVAKLTNTVMLAGEKAIAEGIVYGSFETIQERHKEDPLEVFRKALDNVKPKVEVKSRRVGGATYQVPIEVPARRGRTLAIRWIVLFSRQRREKQMSERLANELLDALGSQGGAFKRKDDLYRMAQANKAFAHYRW